jgi:hypothetical protein
MSTITFYYLKETFNICKSNHLVHPRKLSQFSRDYSISDKAYVDIFKLAISNGLRSFRGQQVVLICSTHKGYISILVDVPKSTNKFIVVTTFTSYDNFWKTFIKVPSRINLLQYTIPVLSEKERQTKDLALVDHIIRTEGTTISAKELLSFYNL